MRGNRACFTCWCEVACRGLETQYPVSAANKWYFIDIALPEARIGIEFDGRGKYGSDV